MNIQKASLLKLAASFYYLCIKPFFFSKKRLPAEQLIFRFPNKSAYFIETCDFDSPVKLLQTIFRWPYLSLCTSPACYTPAETTFLCSTNHQIQRSASMKLAWHNWWSRICCGLHEDLRRHSSLFSSSILCSPFGSCLHVTTLTHSSCIHSPSPFLIFWLPISLPCYLHPSHPHLSTPPPPPPLPASVRWNGGTVSLG